MITFPLALTWADVAALPGAGDAFGWDESMLEEGQEDSTLVATVAAYSEAFTSSDRLTEYLKNIGYELVEVHRLGGIEYTGIIIRSEEALRMAHALFSQICYEYDQMDDLPQVRWITGSGHSRSATATWALFELGGDDDVDYCGSQPSCLTDLLITLRGAQ